MIEIKVYCFPYFTNGNHQYFLRDLIYFQILSV